jgi:hypothetical protein
MLFMNMAFLAYGTILEKLIVAQLIGGCTAAVRFEGLAAVIMRACLQKCDMQ